jgi:2-isopropylmalate synthase
MPSIEVFDSTLRDGAQGEGISFSVKDKIKVTEALAELGVAYIEAGNPTSNRKDMDFFRELKHLDTKNSKVAAFGSTRRKDTSVENDPGVSALMDAGTSVVAIFGKSWNLHIENVLKTTFSENLSMIFDTVSLLKKEGKEVVFDCEHFFDGYKSDRECALSVIEAALSAKADTIALCDTNGGFFPDEVYETVKSAAAKIPGVKFGIHCHNDNGLAVANSIAAVKAGAVQIQGTLLGFGERCGNANLSTLIPNLQIKSGYSLIPPENLPKLTGICNKAAEISNLRLRADMPYIGKSAFAHKAGMHADGVQKISSSFEHIEPETVGNRRRFLVSEMAGRSILLEKIWQIDPSKTKESAETKNIVGKLKELEFSGYQFDGAEGSFELIIRKELGHYKPFFKLISYTIVSENPPILNMSDRATIKIEVGGQTEITAAEGNGPVNALDKALRKALYRFYPELENITLTDYKVRVLEGTGATEAKVRVLIDTTDGEKTWTTIGVSTDIIEASWLALVDSIEYKLINNS